MAAKRVVDAINVGADQVICSCGKVIELEPNPQALSQLVGIDCPKCGAEVRLDRFLEDFTLRSFDFGESAF